MQKIKYLGALVGLLGMIVVVGLIVWSGVDEVAMAVASVGFGIVFLVLTRVVTVSVAGAGWWLLFPPSLRPTLQTCVTLRFVREGANSLLPMPQIGGDLIGARLLSFRGIPGVLSAASIIVDVLMQATTQFLFAFLGLLVLLAIGKHETLIEVATIGIACAVPLLVGFFFAQRQAGKRILKSIVGRMTGDGNWRALGTIDAVYEQFAKIYAAHSGLAISCIVHFSGWIIGVLEVFIVFHFMGHPVSLAEALVIESLMHAIRGAAFALPGSLGAQEGGLILLCAVFGIPPEQALALSLVKRAGDLAVGVPGLLGWHVMEWGRIVPITFEKRRFEKSPRLEKAQFRQMPVELRSRDH
jgi:putative membrane protein